MKIFNTVQDLKEARLTAGQLTETKGYHSAGDGGQARYLIQTSAEFGGTPDEYGTHTLANGNVAVLQVEGAVNVRQFGAKGDGVTDDAGCFSAAFDYCEPFSGVTLSSGKNSVYFVSSLVVNKIVSFTCIDGGLPVIKTNGIEFKSLNSPLIPIKISNIKIIPISQGSLSQPNTALTVEAENKTFGANQYLNIERVFIGRSGLANFYNGIKIKNTSVAVSEVEILALASSSASALNGELSGWENNSGTGVFLENVTYGVVRNAKVYYSTDSIKVTGQSEDVLLSSCMCFEARRNIVFEGLVNPSNQNRVENCHGTAYLKGIDIQSGDALDKRLVLYTILNTSIFRSGACTASEFIYLDAYSMESFFITNFSAFNSTVNGGNDKAIRLNNNGSWKCGYVFIDGVYCKGVGIGVFSRTDGVSNTAKNIIMHKANMVGDAVDVSYSASAGSQKLTTEIVFQNINGNVRGFTPDSNNVLQANIGIDQGGGFKTNAISPFEDGIRAIGSPTLRYAASYVKDTYFIGANGLSWKHGNFNPEGVVTSPPGSLFSRTDTGLLYVKQGTGVGNTGWVVK